MIPVRLRAALAAAGMFALFYWMSLGPRHASSVFDQPKGAADFKFPDLSGKTRALSDFKGKVLILDFWATWCGPCEESIPDLSRLHRDFEKKGFSVVGVALDARGKEVVGPFVEKHKVPYPILLGSPAELREWPIPGFPTSFLIDREGRVLKRYLGAVPYSELAHDVQGVLGS